MKNNTLSPLELMAKLVSFPTISTESNLELIDWVESYLSSHGIFSHRQYDITGRKASLFSHIGPKFEGGLILSGHTDVVPIEGQNWESDPWTLTEKNGKYFGRGTCDMKGFNALAIWAIVEGRYRNLNRPLQLALSYDEEVGCLGAPPMIQSILENLPKASAVIVGEPSEMKVVNAHKGCLGIHNHIIGYEVHSSIMHKGVNAIMAAAKLIEWANRVNDLNSAKEPSSIASLFDPSYTTAHTGKIIGGTAHNITARDCKFDMSFRILPDETESFWKKDYLKKVKEIESQMQKIYPKAKIVSEQSIFVPGLRPEIGGEAETLVRQLTGDNETNAVSYGTEAGQFQEKDYSAIICGPGNIAQAHQPNEFLEKSQLDAGHAFMKKLLDNL